MNRPFLVMALFAATTAALGAQQASQSSPYEGTSSPPPDDTIITSTTPEAKPPAGQPMNTQPPAPVQASQTTQYPSAVNPSYASRAPSAGDGTDDGIVQVALPFPSAAPALADRGYASDPDGDIVHPAPLGRGELGEGTSIRVELMDDLSSAFSQEGEPFRSRVATDVLQGREVVIPAGSEIDGRVADVSSGHFGGHGHLLLRPERVILPDGASYGLHAVVSDTPASRTEVGAEGVIRPGSTLKRDSIEYGGVVTGGAITGAFLGGPAGALAGGLVGAGVVTVHLLVSHPQAHLDSGTPLMLTLTSNMRLEPASRAGN